MTDGQGLATYVYDEVNRLTSVTRGTDAFSYEYDPAGNVTKRTYPGNAVTTYTYDDDARLWKVTQGTNTTVYGYDEASNPTTTTLPSGNGYVETRAYDRAGRLSSVTNKKGTSTLSSFTYTYSDADDLPDRIDQNGGGVSTFSYDPNLDFLTEACLQATCSQGTDPYIRWTYDKVGSRKTETRPAGTTTYAYNADDRLTGRTGLGGTVNYTYDRNGNQTGAGTRSFTYDLENRVKSTTSGSSTITYTYDGLGHRTQASAGTQAAKNLRYAWDENAPLALLGIERDGSNALVRRYTYGADLISMRSGSSDYYYHYDGLGDVANLTSSTGAKQWTYAYEPYGTFRTENKDSRSAPANLMRFTGEYTDSATNLSTGLYYLRARTYDPVTGRFLQLDPVGQGIGDLNVSSYVYAADRPTVLADPSGMAAEATSCSHGGYFDFNLSLFLFDLGYVKESCGRHLYWGLGLGFPGVSASVSPAAVSCESMSLQGYYGPGGAVGVGGPPGWGSGGDRSRWFGEFGIGTPGLGWFLNYVANCSTNNTPSS